MEDTHLYFLLKENQLNRVKTKQDTSTEFISSSY